jgi:hypothetical protein
MSNSWFAVGFLIGVVVGLALDGYIGKGVLWLLQ